MNRGDEANFKGIINLGGLMGSVGAVIILVAYFALPPHRRSTLRRLLTFQSAADLIQGLHYLQVGLVTLSPIECGLDATLLTLALCSSACWSCCIAFHLFADLSSAAFRTRAGPIAETISKTLPFLLTGVMVTHSLILNSQGRSAFYADFGGCFIDGMPRRIAFYYSPLIACIGTSLALYVAWLVLYVRRSRRGTGSGSGGSSPTHLQGSEYIEDLSLVGMPLTERGVELTRYHLILMSFWVLRGGPVPLLIAESWSGYAMDADGGTARMAATFDPFWKYVYLGEAMQGFVNAIFFVLCFM